MPRLFFLAVPPHRDQPYTLGYADNAASFWVLSRRALDTADRLGGRVWAVRDFEPRQFTVDELRATVAAADAVGEHLVDLAWFFGSGPPSVSQQARSGRSRSSTRRGSGRRRP